MLIEMPISEQVYGSVSGRAVVAVRILPLPLGERPCDCSGWHTRWANLEGEFGAGRVSRRSRVANHS